MAILIALSFGLLFLLIAMVVNIGFLVATKINLQNSVDLAAYAGAAQQARYLTEIGKWNYEMRRNYKAMVYDYMIVLNGERKYDVDLKNYMNKPTTDPAGKPYVCASLQRQGSSGGTPSLSAICQNTDPLGFQNALNQMENAMISSAASLVAACASTNFAICSGAMMQATAMTLASTTVSQTVQDQSDALANYEPSFKNNYNRRLIAWMLHDYRHLQTRIRGVHYGNIDIGSFSSTTGRWGLLKDNAPVIFKNSPIGVAAKVLNGYTKIDGNPPSGDVIAANR